MNRGEIEKLLTEGGVKPTANRILVMRELMESSRPVNLADLETALSPMDKASIFRVLNLFAKKNLVHVIEDGSRSIKYEVCHSGGDHAVDDQHAHFYCEKCGSVLCLHDIPLPEIPVPVGYKVKSVNFMIKGICPKCDGENM